MHRRCIFTAKAENMTGRLLSMGEAAPVRSRGEPKDIKRPYYIACQIRDLLRFVHKLSD